MGLPHAPTYARLYPRGLCCARHTPAALAGRPEPAPGPGWPAGSYLNQPDNTEPEGEAQR
ncbi:hypothetical protein [Streptomyces sp. NRRL F-5135]|uniref:hypothetical protein n=1 Tax=Streptomyces sp. NRRL F-5135 TaxID=1463858 RepID=UPI000AEB69DD|nr:hypothetical protein [Streptomyces sp. NRRL F-5135]